MSQLYVGSIVPGRKPRNNPWTMTGRPSWNTFQGLGMRSTVKDIQHQAREAGERGGGGGGRRKRKLDPRNVCHRACEHSDLLAGWLRKCIRLSLQIDTAEGALLDNLLDEYNDTIMDILAEGGGRRVVEVLIRKEKARGVVRAARALR